MSVRVVAINGSPRLDRGNTALLLDPFLQGMAEAGAAVDLYQASLLDVRPCSCGVMHCWNADPGQCCIQDDMQRLYPVLNAAGVLVLATPVYIPLPGQMQNLINRLCPLLDPILEFHTGRTRARMRQDCAIRQMVLVSTSGWWEIENFGTVVRIVEELAADAGVKYVGALLRPHAYSLKKKGVLTPDGSAVLTAARKAGHDLIQEGRISPETLALVSKPLISAADYFRLSNPE